jgi:hypothetical protein
MTLEIAADLMWELGRMLDSLRSRRCLSCGGRVSLNRSPEGTAAWYCPRCSRRARAGEEWLNSHGWLTKQGDYWVVVDSGDPERQQAQLEAYRLARAWAQKGARNPQAATLVQLAARVQSTARYLNAAVQREEASNVTA